MCLLAVFFRVVEDAAVVVGANREEAYDRGGEPPSIQGDRPRFLAGRDPRAGGTWLGVNEHGVLAALTNRAKTRLPSEPRSRGWLVRDLLACATARNAAELAARELGRDRYAGCNVLCADWSDAFVLHAGDWLRVRPLPPGLHVLTAHDVNDASDRRLGHALWWLGQRNYGGGIQCLAALQELCAQRGNGDPAICLRGEKGGTVSSSLIALRTPLGQSTWLHAQGAPDRTPYADMSHLLRQLVPAEPGGG
jgi:hypothetical protein